MKKRVEISIETQRVTVVHLPVVKAWCDACGATVELVTADDAGTVTGLSTRAVCRLVEAGRLHFSVSPSGLLRLCLNSVRSLSDQLAGRCEENRP